MKLFAFAVIAAVLTSCGGTTAVVDTKGSPPEEAAKVAEPPKPEPVAMVIPAGTRVRVQTTSALSTKTVESGAPFTGNLAEPILIDGKTVVPKGAEVAGVVANSDDGGRVKGVASLSLRLTQITAGGKRLPVETSLFTQQARATKKKDAVKIGIGAGIGAAIGAIAGGGEGAAIGAASGGGAGTAVVLATHGDPAVIGAESIVSFKLTSGLTVD